MQVDLLTLYKSPGHSYKGRHGIGSLEQEIIECDEFELIAGAGIKGDRYFNHKPDFKGQITLFDHRVYEEVRKQFDLPSLSPQAFRRNVIIQGVDLNTLIGKRFKLGGIEFSGSEEAAPCYWMNEACADGVHDFLKGKGGLRCRIHTDGLLPLGSHSLSLI